MSDRELSLTDLNADSLGAAAVALLRQQRRAWPMLADNYAALAEVRLREVDVDGLVFRLQFNPARIASSGAKVDAKSIAARPCFLCEQNLPPQQRAVPFCDRYQVLVNPFPILPEHFTVPRRAHVPQIIRDAFPDLVELTRQIGPHLMAFYNGPRCGASAPDHLHFQAGNVGVLPIEAEVDDLARRFGRRLGDHATLIASPLRPLVLIESDSVSEVVRAFRQIHDRLATPGVADEPMMNVLCYAPENGRLRVLVLPRARHRPSFYSAEGDSRILLSPGAIDMGGLCVCPLVHDFDRITAQHLRQMLTEVSPPGDALIATLDAR